MMLKDIFNKWNKPTKILTIVVVFSIFFIFYGIWFESRAGGMNIHIRKQGTVIYIDEGRVVTTKYDDEIVTINRISPGKHSLLIYKEGYFPWEKIIEIETSKVTEVRPFYVRSEINDYTKKTQFTTEEEIYISRLFNNSKSKVSFDGDGNVKIEIDENKIIATWLGDDLTLPKFFCNDTRCSEEILVLDSSTGNVKNIAFYPNRDDVILFSIGAELFAIEIDKNSFQNFQPIYTGTSPSFTVDKKSLILYIKDEDITFGVIL